MPKAFTRGSSGWKRNETPIIYKGLKSLDASMLSLNIAIKQLMTESNKYYKLYLKKPDKDNDMTSIHL